MLKNTEIIRAVIATPNNADRIMIISIMLSFELLPSEQLQIIAVNKIVIIILYMYSSWQHCPYVSMYLHCSHKYMYHWMVII